MEVGTLPAASCARIAVVDATSSDGNGWVSRTTPATRSDVDQLPEVRHEVVDQAGAAVRHPGAQAGHQGVERDGRDHEVAVAVPPERGGRPAAGCEHPFEFGLAELRLAPEVTDDLDDPATLDDIAHQLRDPGIELVVGLIAESLPVFLRVGR